MIKRKDEEMGVSKRFRTRSGREGLTLVELMVVLVILGLLAGLVGTNVIRYVKDAKVTDAKAQIAMLANAVKFFKLDTGEYPDNSIGLEALVEEPPGVTGWRKGGYMESPEVPKDAWSNEYYYENPGRNSKAFDIYSLGADGREGGEDYDADIYNSESGADGGSS